LILKSIYNTEFVSVSEKNVNGFVARKGTARSTGRVIGPQNFVYVDLRRPFDRLDNHLLVGMYIVLLRPSSSQNFTNF
jgi:hypothetical protein